MSLTIFYKGSLRDGRDVDELADIVARYVGGMDAELVREGADSLVVYFEQGTSEPMAFRFTAQKMDGFCKWDGADANELYSLFDMFYELKPLFKRLAIHDDEGLWYQYIAEKTPCKIELRALTDEEEELLTRMESNVSVPVSDVESFLMEKTRYRKANAALARLVVQDFMEATGINIVQDFEPSKVFQMIVDMRFNGEYGYEYGYGDLSYLDFIFSRHVLEFWLFYSFNYVHYGRVNSTNATIRGLQTSKDAFIQGMLDLFFGRYSAIANSKHAEMVKFASRHYKPNPDGLVSIIDEPRRELEMLFSMTDYLGFKYVGLEK